MTEDIRTQLVTGRIDPPRVGVVTETGQRDIPYALADHSGASIDAVADWVRDPVLGDVSTRTARSYCYALLTWFGAALLGHLNIQTTRGYVAVFEEDVVQHYQQFLANRRHARAESEYRDPTADEWHAFEGHFDSRKVELGCAGVPTEALATTNTPAYPNYAAHGPTGPIAGGVAQSSGQQSRRPGVSGRVAPPTPA